MTRRRGRVSSLTSQRWRHFATAAMSCCYSARSNAFVPSGPLHHQRAKNCSPHFMAAPTALDAPICGDSPCMFLDNGKLTSPYSILIKRRGSDRYGGHAVSSQIEGQSEDQDKMILGFEVLDTPTSPLKNQLASNIRRRQELSSLPAWFPWLPSRSQLQMLKVTELREACAERDLKKSGNKKELQDRIWEWTQLQHQKRILNARGSALGSAIDMKMPLRTMYGNSRNSDTIFRRYGKEKNQNRNKKPSATTSTPSKKEQPKESQPPQKQQQPDSLEDWARNVDLDTLLNRRRAIRREAEQGKKTKHNAMRDNAESVFKRTPTKEDVSSLTDAFEAPPSLYSNLQVKQMYAAAKEADKVGDRVLCRQILTKLKEATPNDARIFRRLARMESEEGRVHQARKVLQEGLRLHPNNAFLWHGLGQLELKARKDEEARLCFQKAISADPSLPHPYHALGTLEHTHGRIAAAMKLLKEGIRYSPKNHRLHHALGDLYREAKMLDMAETSYRRSLEHGNTVNHGFAYTALAYVAYEKGALDECRHWLKEAVSLNNGRNSRSWVAWGQMEEAEGNIDDARKVYIEAIAQYEHGLIHRDSRRNTRRNRQSRNTRNGYNTLDVKRFSEATPIPLDFSSDDIDDSNGVKSIREKLLKRVPPYRSGDKFVNVYRNWARLEERYGDQDAVDSVYERATTAFPRDYQLSMRWAQYAARTGDVDRARSLFEDSCKKANSWHADPYRLYGEFEMSLGNYARAKSILFRGAQAVSNSSDGGLGNRSGMAQLFHTWAVCEWYLDNLSRAEVLFDHALRLTNGGHDGSEILSYILYSIARLECFREEYELAQHFVGLSLMENMMPGGNSKTWKLWAVIAKAMGNEDLAEECEQWADKTKLDEDNGGVESLSRLLGMSRPRTASATSPGSSGPSMQHLMRKDPWYQKIFNQSTVVGAFDGVQFPDSCL